MQLINIDNGGTFTDICVIDGSHVSYTKTITTPYDLSRCLFDGLRKAAALNGNGNGLGADGALEALLQKTDYIRYSTTQGTNALVQRQGPRLGLLVADGTLPALLAANAEQRELLDALVGDRSETIDLAADDETLGAQLVGHVNGLAARGASRLVVAIGSDAGREAERRVKRLLLRLYPRHLLGAIPLLFSWELVADRDDVRRTWSSLLNAFLHPAMERFLFSTERRLREQRTRRPLLIFRNDGGSSRVAKSSALKTYSSGPRGGLEGTRMLARQYGFDDVLMVDVGGTTTDVGVVTNGNVRVERRGAIDVVPSSFELAAITSYGVGGSSVIRVDAGKLTVGPRSVGSAPGPACFGLGGNEATITDVHLLSGLLDPATYLDGSIVLDAEASRKVVLASVAEPLGVTLDEALWQMERAYLERVATVLRAEAHSRDCVIAAFGGGGPMTVCGAAALAGLHRAIVPRTAAVFSAFGIGHSDISQSYEYPLGTIDAAGIAAAVAEMRLRAERDFFAEGAEPAECRWEFRYVASREGKSIVIPLDEVASLPADARAADVASLELTVVAPLPHDALAAGGDAPKSIAVTTASRDIRGRDGSATALPVYTLLELSKGAAARGPAIVEGPFFTMRLPEDWRFEITDYGDLLCTGEVK